MVDSNKKRKKKIIIVIIFCVFLLIVCRSYFSFSNIDKPIEEPKENLKDVPIKPVVPIEDEKESKKNHSTEIIITSDDIKDVTTDEKENEEHSIEDKTENKIKEPDKDPEEDIDPGIFSVRDDIKKWENISNLSIFDTNFSVSGKIAPGMKNDYLFTIRNKTGVNLFYSINFICDNPNNINIKYRLKYQEEYIIGSRNEWVLPEELNVNNIKIKNGDKNTYILEWYWLESSDDTNIGMEGNVTYGLQIDVTAEEEI